MIPKNLWKRGMPSHVPPSPQMGLGLGCMAYRCVSLISLCLQDKFSRKNFVNIWTGFIGSTHESSYLISIIAFVRWHDCSSIFNDVSFLF